MIYFDNDYMVGAHPNVMKRLNETNGLHTVGYGRDEFTKTAEQLILSKCDLYNGAVYFLEGGTQANAVVIDRLLDHNDGVLATDTAHINVHEAGAIEANGHKIITLPNHDGKLSASDIFDSLIKLHGATLAKGRLLGVQFTQLFTDNLYLSIGKHAVSLAMRLKSGFINRGYQLYIDSPTNQQFVILPNDKIEQLRAIASFEFWGPKGEKETPVRFVTDWSITNEDVDTLLSAI